MSLQDTVDCGKADPVNVCEMDFVFKDPVSDITQGDGIIFQYHIDYGGLLLICEFPAFASSCWSSFCSVESIATFYSIHIFTFVKLHTCKARQHISQ